MKQQDNTIMMSVFIQHIQLQVIALCLTRTASMYTHALLQWAAWSSHPH